MLIRHASDIRSSEITDQKLYVNRREFIRALTVTAAAGAGILAGPPLAARGGPARPPWAQAGKRPEKPAERDGRKAELLGRDHDL